MGPEIAAGGQPLHSPSVFSSTVLCFTKATSPAPSARHLRRWEAMRQAGVQLPSSASGGLAWAVLGGVSDMGFTVMQPGFQFLVCVAVWLWQIVEPSSNLYRDEESSSPRERSFISHVDSVQLSLGRKERVLIGQLLDRQA